MTIRNTLLATLLLGLTVSAFAQAPTSATQPVTGKATVKLQYVHAVSQSGSPDPAHDADCKKASANYVGLPVTSMYSINTQTLMMSAESSFPSPTKTQPLQLTVKLNPLGIAGTYAFGTFRPPALPAAYAVMFSLNTKFADASSTFILFGPQGGTYNCVVSSSMSAMKAAESAKFKMEK